MKFVYPDKFELFWQEYPKKQGKYAALQAWEKMDKKFGISNGNFDEVLTALKAQKEAKMFSDNPQYIPLPVTWINQARWDDEVKPVNGKEKSKWQG